jgi:O-antigen/teichoic acid export membrane protein
MELIIILAFPLVVGGGVLAPKIINSLYGQEFAPSALALQILLVMTGIVFIYSVFQKSLIIFDQQKKIFQTMLAGVILNIGLNVILIPKYSLYGAAVATVVTHLLILFLQLIFVLKIDEINLFNPRIIQAFFGAIICSVAMYFIISLPSIYSLPVALSIFVGAVIYLILLWAYKKTIDRFFKIIPT